MILNIILSILLNIERFFRNYFGKYSRKGIVVTFCFFFPFQNLHTTVLPIDNNSIFKDVTTVQSNTMIYEDVDTDGSRIAVIPQFLLIVLLGTLLIF